MCVEFFLSYLNTTFASSTFSAKGRNAFWQSVVRYHTPWLTLRLWRREGLDIQFECYIRLLNVWSSSAHFQCKSQPLYMMWQNCEKANRSLRFLRCIKRSGWPTTLFFCVLTPILIQPDTQNTGCCFHSPTRPCYPSRRDLFPPLVDPTKVDGDPDLFHSARLSDYNVFKTPACIPFQAWNPAKTNLLTLAKSNSQLALLVEQIGCIEWDYSNQPGGKEGGGLLCLRM